MTSQFNWSLFRRTAHTHTHTQKNTKAIYHSLFEAEIHASGLPSHRQVFLKAFPCAYVIISQEHSYMRKPEPERWRLKHIVFIFMSMSWHTYTCLSQHQPFVREISPWITLKRIRYAGLYCFRFISLNNFYISEVPMIWFAVTLMWCPYYDKGVVNFDVTVLLISYTKILCVKRGYFKKPWSHYDVRHTIYRRIQLNLTGALSSLVAPELSLW